MNFNWTCLWFSPSPWTWKGYHERIKINIQHYFSVKIVKMVAFYGLIKPVSEVLYLQQNAISKKLLNEKILFQNEYI